MRITRIMLAIVLGVALLWLLPSALGQDNTKLTEVESLKLQNLVQQRTILLQQQQILKLQYEKSQADYAQLVGQAKDTFETVAKEHKLKMVFNPDTFQLEPAPESKKEEPKGK